MSSLCALTIGPAEPEKDQLAACRIVTTILEHKMKYKERMAYARCRFGGDEAQLTPVTSEKYGAYSCNCAVE
jgi:hypothetical protein